MFNKRSEHCGECSLHDIKMDSVFAKKKKNVYVMLLKSFESIITLRYPFFYEHSLFDRRRTELRGYYAKSSKI